MKLEDLINENREFFDDRKPLEGHQDRFRRKLGSKKNMTPHMWAVAAAMAGIILIAALGYLLKNENDKRSIYAQLPQDLQETVYYYTSMNQAKLDKIMEMENIDKTTREKLIMEVKEKEELNEIIDDLQKFPGDERVRNALIEYYRSRTEFLDYIINQVRELNYTASL